MWIKHQDKQSLRVYQGICIDYQDENEILGDAPYPEGESENYFVLGRYNSKERALEVIGEIEEHLNLQRSCVYEMPEE